MSVLDNVAIYCRLSDEDRFKQNANDESESIQNQKLLLTKYAVEKGWSIYKIYSDEDYSGLDKDRPEFNFMLQDAEAGKFNIILCKSQSRFTRDMELVEKYLHNQFLDWGIRFIGIVDNSDTLEKGNKKSRQINGLVNEWYCEDTSESIKAVFRAKAKSGKFIGSFATYGYKKDPNDRNKLVIDEEAAEIVKMIFSLYMEGNGTQHISYIMNEKNISNPTKYKQDLGLNFKNSSQTDGYGLWNKTTVKRILKNEVYIGNMVQGKRKKVSYKSKKIVSTFKDEWIVVEDTHPPIIDKRTFIGVQKKLINRMRSSGKGQAHIFATKVKCMDCHNTMQKSSSSGYAYLRCKLYCLNKELCSSHTLSLNQLQEMVTEELKSYISSYCNSESLVSKLQHEEMYKNKTVALENELKRVAKDIEEKNTIIKNLYTDKVKGLLTEEQFIDLNKAFLAEKDKLIKRQEKVEIEISSLSERSNTMDKWVDVVNKYRDFTELTHTIVDELIDYIEVGEKDKKTKEQRIIINWLF